MVVILIDIVNSNLTAIFSEEQVILRIAANVADVLVVILQIVTTDTAALNGLDKDTAAPSLIAPVIAG